MSIIPRQERFLAALLQYATAKAAAAANISERTASRWLNEDVAFQRAYADARRSLLDRVFDRLLRSSDTASGVLVGLLQVEDETVRLRAALATLEATREHIARADVQQRIAQIEHERRRTAEDDDEAIDSGADQET